MSVKGQCTGTNLALGQPCTQESTYSGDPCDDALDGSLSTNYFSGTTASTQYHSDPWWAVDLGDDYIIECVKVTSISNSCK